MNIHQTKDTLSVAEAVKNVLAPDVQLEKKISETEIAPADKAAHDDHVVDKKKNPESEKQTEENLEEAVDNFFGFSTKDGLVKFQSMAKKLKIKPISNPVVMKRGGKEFHVMGFEGSVSDIEKAMKVAAGMQESSDFTKEGNEFTAAAAKAKLAGEDEFEFDGKKYPVEIGQDAAEKILGKKEEVEIEESVELQEAADFGDIEKVMKWAKKNLSDAKLDISKKYGTAFINLTIFNIIILRLGGKKGIVVTHDDRTKGKGKDYEEYFSSANDVIKFVQKIYDEMPKDESIEVEEAVDLEEAELDEKVAPNLKVIANVRREIAKAQQKFDAAIKKGDTETASKIADELHVLRKKLVNFYNEGAELDEAIKPADFVKGGDTKVTKREVDAMLSKIFMNNRLAKQVEDSEAYQAGEKDKGKKKNPYKKDTADFQLYELGVQSSQAS